MQEPQNIRETDKCLNYVFVKYLNCLDNPQEFIDKDIYTIYGIEYEKHNMEYSNGFYLIPKDFNGFNKFFNDIFMISKMNNKLFFNRISFQDDVILNRQFICDSSFQTEEISCNKMIVKNLDEVNKHYNKSNQSIADFIRFSSSLYGNNTMKSSDIAIVKKDGSSIKYGRICSDANEVFKFSMGEMDNQFIDIPDEDQSAFEIIDTMEKKKEYVKSLKK